SSGVENLRGVRRHVLTAQHELFELESKTFLQAENAAWRTQSPHDFGLSPRYKKSQHLVTRNEVLDQCRSLGKCCAYGINRRNRPIFDSSVFSTGPLLEGA